MLKLRRAQAADEHWLLELQSQPSVREYARNKAAPTPEEHHAWMAATLNSDRRELYIIETDKPVGMARLDQALGTFEVSIAISEPERKKGYALQALKQLQLMKPDAALRAFILPENTASRALFSKAGYEPVGSNWYRLDHGQRVAA